jgi:ribonuclease HI
MSRGPRPNPFEDSDLADHGAESPVHASRPSSIDSDGEPRSRIMATDAMDLGESEAPIAGLDGKAVQLSNSIKFSGHWSELAGLWVHLRLRGVLDPALSNEKRKCAYCLSLFEGDAAVWATRQVRTNQDLLLSFNDLKALVSEVFDIDMEAKKAIYRGRMMRLRQVGTALEFTQEFERLAGELELSLEMQHLLFTSKLDLKLQQDLIRGNVTDYQETRDEAIRLDSSMRATTNKGTANKNPRKKKKAAMNKCTKCGRTNHKTEDCFAKIGMIRFRETLDSTRESQYVPVTIEGTERNAFVDTGAELNCIRANLVSGPTIATDRTIEGPAGEPIATRAEYILVEVESTLQAIYLIPNLTEEVIFGKPYYTEVTPCHILEINTFAEWDDGGRIRPMSTIEVQALDKAIDEGLANGNIEESHTTKAANVLFVPKKNGELRMCIDYRPVNKVTITDKYPIPILTELVADAAKYRWYTLLDNKDAFNRIVIRIEHRHKTAFKTYRGVFQYTHMPFGLTNAPSTYQRWLTYVLRDHRLYVSIYVDDVLIKAQTKEELIGREKAVRKTLAIAGAELNQKKLQVQVQEVVFLGRKVSYGKIDPMIDLESIRSWPSPKNVTHLQSYLGTLNYHRPHTPNLAQAIEGLYKKTSKNKKWTWSEEDEREFMESKKTMENTMTLTTFDPSAHTHLYTDASGFGLGAIMMQKGMIVSILSRGLTNAEKNYTTTEWELLAVIWALKKLRHYVESNRGNFTVMTDHAALVKNLNPDGANRRINRWIEQLQGLQVTLEWVAGESNPADKPSRRYDYAEKSEARNADRSDNSD